MKLRIPVTFGFYNFKLSDVLESGLPDKLSTLALVPELRFEFPVAETWQLMPFAAAGVGRDFSADRVNYSFAGGVRSLATFDWRSVDLYLGNRLFYTGYTTSGFEFGDDFGALESGLDARHSLGFSLGDHQVDGGLFVMNYLYFVSPELIRFYGKPLSVDVQWEFGVTFGTMTPWKVGARDTQDRHELSCGRRRFGLSTRSGRTLQLEVLLVELLLGPGPPAELVVTASGTRVDRMDRVLSAPHRVHGTSDHEAGGREEQRPVLHHLIEADGPEDEDCPLEQSLPGRSFCLEAAEDHHPYRQHEEQD